MKIAFFGTPEFAGNILEGILKFSEIEIVLVVSQADKAVWRKKELQSTAVKKIALENGIEVMQPEKLKITQSWILSLPEEKGATKFSKTAEDFHEDLKKWELDFIVVVAYWKIIPTSILDIPKFGCINLHGSILPKYRWASPVQASVKAWDAETWLTTMYMSKWMDEGDMLLTEKVVIEADDTSLDIFEKFSEVWPELLRKTLTWVVSWELKWIPQNHGTATYCWKISREDGEVFFQKQNSQEIYNIYRAYTPWPGIYTWYEGKRLVLEEVQLYNPPLSDTNSVPLNKGGHWTKWNTGWTQGSSLGDSVVAVPCACQESWCAPWNFLKLAKNRYGIICSNWEVLEILQVKLEWKKTTDIQSFVNGNREVLEYCFG